MMVAGEVLSFVADAVARPHSGGSGVMAAVMGMMTMIWSGTLLFTVVWVASLWKIFDKAGEPGWYALIPILNLVTVLKIIGKPWPFIFIALIPCVGFLVLKLIMDLGMAERFGQSTGYAVGLFLLPIVFLPMLGFGSATYKAP